MTTPPKAIRRTVQQALRTMLASKYSKPMALVIQANLRKREATPLLQMLKGHKTVKTETLLAVSRAIKG